MNAVFVSHAVEAERLPFSIKPTEPEYSHKGWSQLFASYNEGLIACGLKVRQVIRPEIYQTDIARNTLGVSEGDWHLAIKPLHHIRPFHGIPNVFFMDWPFLEISCTSGGLSPFFNHQHLLSQAHVIACCAEHNVATLHKLGLRHAVYVPPYCNAPVELHLPGPNANQKDIIILSELSAKFFYRHHMPLVRGFFRAKTENPMIKLVIILDAADQENIVDFKNKVLAVAEISDEGNNLIIIRSTDIDDVSKWKRQANFFLWDGFPLGFPMPVVNAALAGLPLIIPKSIAHTLGLPPSHYIPLETSLMPVNPLDEPVVRVLPLQYNVPTLKSFADAIACSAALDVNSRSAIGLAVKSKFEIQFGQPSFHSAITKTLEMMQVRSHGRL